MVRNRKCDGFIEYVSHQFYLGIHNFFNFIKRSYNKRFFTSQIVPCVSSFLFCHFLLSLLMVTIQSQCHYVKETQSQKRPHENHCLSSIFLILFNYFQQFLRPAGGWGEYTASLLNVEWGRAQAAQPCTHVTIVFW